MLRKTLLFLLLATGSLFSNGARDGVRIEVPDVATPGEVSTVNTTRMFYDNLGLEPVISYDAFEEALKGYIAIDEKESDILTLIDFSKPSNVRRLAIIDMKHGRLIDTSVVSHGQGSGELYARKFSNRDKSHQSSLGFYLTAGTYQGGNGYSLRLVGLEKGYNDNALSRAIVMHGADYCSESVTKTGQRLGRSWGCPAVPMDKSRKIIDTIKGGSVLFIYADDTDYLAHSPVLSRADRGQFI